MTQEPLWAHIPAELRERPQWLVAGPNKAPLGIDAHGRTYNGSVSDPATWCAFDVAACYAYTHRLHIGYVITRDDPFCCIDLDWCDEASQIRKGKEVDEDEWSPPATRDKYYRIIQGFDSYTEFSTYGQGYHIWVRAAIGSGCKPSGENRGIEVYSELRFIVCTGNRVGGTNSLIEDRNDIVNQMVNDFRKGIASRANLPPLIEIEPLKPDEQIWALATGADNALKFVNLCKGDWKNYGFPSQSEADLALMSMFTFYTPSNSQCRRMFRQTVLGQRSKAVKNDKYVNFTLQIIRARQQNEEMTPADHDTAKANANALLAKMNAPAAATHTPLHSVQHTMQPSPLPLAVAAATLTNAPPPTNGELGFPPGLAGAIAQFIYLSAPRPVKEVAIVGALGLLAGICGKAWHISQSGLNIYMILIARSGIGKEAMHSGLSALIKACMFKAPKIMDFVQFNDFASGPALVKFCATNASFVNVAGEWGRKLKRLADDNSGDTAIATLRTVMTNLYQKSGPQAIVGGIAYSNKDNNIDSVSGVAYSLIGETTPSTFYEALTESMMEDGFLSRFNIVEYTGDRPDTNMTPVLDPHPALVEAVGNLAMLAASINGVAGIVNANQRQSVPVQRTEGAQRLLWLFEQDCDASIRGSNDESWRQMWNRAWLKAARIAALLAVADNPMHPVMQEHHVEWSLDLVRRDIAIMRRKLEAGDVGTGDYTRQRKLSTILQEYLTQPLGKGYDVPPAMRDTYIVPRAYLQIRTSRITTFSKHRMGATKALDETLRDFVDSGYLMECDKGKMQTDHNYRGRCYLILKTPEYKAKDSLA